MSDNLLLTPKLGALVLDEAELAAQDARVETAQLGPLVLGAPVATEDPIGPAVTGQGSTEPAYVPARLRAEDPALGTDDLDEVDDDDADDAEDAG